MGILTIKWNSPCSVLETYSGPQVPPLPVTKRRSIEPGNALSQAQSKKIVAAKSIVSHQIGRSVGKYDPTTENPSSPGRDFHIYIISASVQFHFHLQFNNSLFRFNKLFVFCLQARRWLYITRYVSVTDTFLAMLIISRCAHILDIWHSVVAWIGSWFLRTDFFSGF